MSSKWEKQYSVIDITCHRQSHKKTMYYLAPNLSNRDELKQPPCSLLTQRAGTTTKDQDVNQLPIELCLRHLSQIMEISSNLFDFQTLELISQSLQPSQNPAKDPRGTPEHGTSICTRRRIWNFQASSQVHEALLHINPTCGVEAELGI